MKWREINWKIVLMTQQGKWFHFGCFFTSHQSLTQMPQTLKSSWRSQQAATNENVAWNKQDGLNWRHPLHVSVRLDLDPRFGSSKIHFVLLSLFHSLISQATMLMRGFEFMFMTNPQVPYRVILTRLGQPVFWLETVRGLQHLFMCRFACLKHYQGLETRLGQMSHLFWTNVNILLQETSAQHSSENINRRSWYVFFYSHHLDVLLPVTLMQRRFQVKVWVLWLEPCWYWILSANTNVV